MYFPSEPLLLLIPAGSIFVIDLTLSLKTSVPAKGLQNIAEMNEVKWKSLTLKGTKGSSLKQKMFHNKTEG